MKLWGGRFEKATDKKVDDFNSSIRFDQRLYRQDIKGSIAHARMLGKQGIISLDDSLLIIKTLNEILEDIESGKVEFEIDAEDIHMNVEKILIERIGDVGKRLHTGRSRNDQVALDIRMYVKEEIVEISKMLIELTDTLISIAKEHTKTIMPGYTHLQKAQPVTFAHHCSAYINMLLRDLDRLKETYRRTNVMPLGSGALAGTTHPLDRLSVAQELKFDSVTLNSLDGVSDRDFALELSFDLSLVMMHLSRFSEELILWSSNEFRFVTMDDAYSTGSSIMPQKKNPDVAELIRGKTGRVYGSLMALLTVMKGIPLAYNKDMQEDKESLFDTIDTVKLCVPVFNGMVKTMRVNKDEMLKGAKGGFANATDVADYLVKKGVPFREAHAVVGRMVLYAEKHQKALDDLTIDEMKNCSEFIEEDIYEAISMTACVEGRSLIGGPAESAVLNSLSAASKMLDQFKSFVS